MDYSCTLDFKGRMDFLVNSLVQTARGYEVATLSPFRTTEHMAMVAEVGRKRTIRLTAENGLTAIDVRCAGIDHLAQPEILPIESRNTTPRSSVIMATTRLARWLEQLSRRPLRK
ncbi:MAG TPA: hypothetical protein VGL22_13310 [Terracidiphilus sp.]|jgi:hypothetical protein